MTSKDCIKCGENKLIEYFRLNKTKRQAICKNCICLTQSKRVRNIRAWFKQYKRNCSCSKCGYSKETHESFSCRALEFHHHNDDKSFNIGNAVASGFAIKKIKEEIDKCTVLCSRCHMEIHSQ